MMLSDIWMDWKRKIAPFHGTAVFVVVVVGVHLLWRLFIVTGVENQEYNESRQQGGTASLFAETKEQLWVVLGAGSINHNMTNGQYIALLNKDITSLFIPWAEKTASINYLVMTNIARQHIYLMDDDALMTKTKCKTILSYDKKVGPAINIIWGCTGVKQIYIFFFVMLFSKGVWSRKLIYFLLGVFILLMFNVVRISCVFLALKSYPSSFEFLHDGLFKYLFYGVMFLLWMLWDERYSLNKNNILGCNERC